MNVTLSDLSNNSTSSSGVGSFIDIGPYQNALLALGAIGAIENTGILLALCSTRRLLKSSSLLIGLTLGHALNGFMNAMIVVQMHSGTEPNVTRLSCMLTWLNPYIVLYQMLPVFLVLVGTERLLAMAAPIFYRRNCTPARQRMVITSAYAFGFGIFLSNIVWAWIDPSPSFPCSPATTFGEKYMALAVHAPAAVGGTTALIVTLIGVRAGRRRIRKLPASSQTEIERLKRQIRITQSILAVSGIDIDCVVIPNLALLFYNLGLIDIPLTYQLYVGMLYCTDSASNIVAFLLFNKEFRDACVRLLTCRRTDVKLISITPLRQVDGSKTNN